MNFKYTYLAGVCALAATSLASCSSDTPEPSPADEKVNMAFHISIDDLTRADGTAANGDPQTLQYAVYGTKSDGSTGLLFSDLTETAPQAVKNDDGSFTLNLSLPKNSTFEIAFWAETDCDETASEPKFQRYIFNRENATVTMKYGNGEFNTTAADAYFGYTTRQTKGSGETAQISLKRPFSQINIGTTSSDDVNKIVANNKAESWIMLSGTNFPDVLNLKDGSVSFSDIKYDHSSITFSGTRMPQNITYPVEGYTYLGLVYVLSTAPTPIVGSEGTQDASSTNTLTCDIHFSINPNGSVTPLFQQEFKGVQLRANTRTNIYGTLLSPTDITIIINGLN